MSKQFRRIIMLLLAVIITAAAPLTAAAAPALSAVSEESPISEKPPVSQENSMETALVAIKNLVDIDDDIFTDFSYSSSFSNYETMEGQIWSFYWSDLKSAYIFATVMADGSLLQFRKLNMEERSFGFAEISKDAAVSAADEFIKKAKPDSYGYFKAPSDVNININNSEYSFNYYAEVNGYSFTSAQTSVNVNKFTGEITAYSTSNIEPGRYRFDTPAGIISVSEAINAYADKIGLELEYRSYRDYENNTITVYPVYLLDPADKRFISAVSGDVVEYVYDRGDGSGENESGNNAGAAPMAAADMGASGTGQASRAALSSAEISALERVSGFLTNEQALQKLLEATELTDLDVSSFSDRYINLNRDYIDRNRYYYDIMLYRYDDTGLKDDEITAIFGRVNAETGRVTSFNLSYPRAPYSNAESNYSEEQAEAIVNSFLEKMAPNELNESVRQDLSQNYREYAYNFQYIRYKNDVPFSENQIRVTLDQNNGKIINYSLNWYDNVTFPDVSNVMSPRQALGEFIGQVGAGVNYTTVGEGNTALVYEFKSRDMIDPFTGKALDYNGSLWEDSTVTPEYGDISGHWSDSIVTRLLDNGVFLWSGSFEPNKVMTELEFLQYILLLESYYAPVDPISYMAVRGVSIEADADKPLTRQEAARIIIEYMGYGKLAEQSEWFVYPFNDIVDGEYKGYITMCYMLGIVNGSNGRFDAQSIITRAQAASILYNLILAKS